MATIIEGKEFNIEYCESVYPYGISVINEFLNDITYNNQMLNESLGYLNETFNDCFIKLIVKVSVNKKTD